MCQYNIWINLSPFNNDFERVKISNVDVRHFSIAYRSLKKRNIHCFRLRSLIFSTYRAYSSGADSNQTNSQETDLVPSYSFTLRNEPEYQCLLLRPTCLPT